MQGHCPTVAIVPDGRLVATPAGVAVDLCVLLDEPSTLLNPALDCDAVVVELRADALSAPGVFVPGRGASSPPTSSALGDMIRDGALAASEPPGLGVTPVGGVGFGD